MLREWRRPASSGEGTIFSRLWAPDDLPARAVIMIAHGMEEHSGRYAHFAGFLNAQGFVVAMNDHAGHGESIIIPGYFARKDGWNCLVSDLDALRDELHQEYPDLPFFVMGHSLGSCLMRT